MAAKTEQKQVAFLWEGTDKRGGKIKGEADGTTAALIKADLRRQGINPTKVRKKPKPLFGGGGKAITPKDIAIFSRQLATMMSAGVPLVQAFEIVGRGHENPRMQNMIMAIKSDVESGSTLASSLRKFPLHFDPLFCNLVDAGEKGGILETLLHKIASYKEKTEALKAKVKKAMSYPIAVVVVAFIITSILLIYVIPQFEELFSSFGADLPALTMMVMQLSIVFQEWWYVIFGGIFAAVFAFKQAKLRSEAFRRVLDRLSLKIPIFGDITEKSIVARFARTLATMFAAGVPLVDSLDSVAGAAGNSLYSDAILRIRDDISTGTQLNVSMKNTGMFPSMVVQMVAIGEESGSLDQMLSKVADFYEEEVDNLVDSLSSLLEPIIMAFLGVVIGGLVIAMYLPIFQMGQVV